MKILYIANVRLPTEKAHGLQIMKMCEAFAALGNTVELLVPTRKSSIAEDPFSYYRVQRNFTITTVRVPNTISFGRFGFITQHLLFSFRALVYASNGSMDIIYSRDPVVLAFLGRRRVDAVFETHTGSDNRFFRWCARRVPRLIAISGGLRAYWINQGIQAERIIVAPDAVDLKEFTHPETKAIARKRLNLPLDANIALYIGRIDGWKGTETLCAAAAFLSPEIEIVIIGGEDEQIRKMQQAYPRVRFLGYRPYVELASNQQAGDVLILPNTAKNETSATFTSPLKLFTYMASGIPMIASDLPSIREIVDERSAYLVAPDEPKALAQAISRVFSDPEHARSIALEARGLVQTYTWETRARAICAWAARR